MNAIKAIAIWGIVAMASAAVAGVGAAVRNRDHSWWAVWSFLFPPMVILLFLLPRNTGPRPRRPSLDEEDAGAG